jgi:hypothetical protein
MTPEERVTEGMGESIEDLEAPAAAQADVTGGKTTCSPPTCQGDSTVSTFCQGHASSCSATKRTCSLETAAVVVSEL